MKDAPAWLADFEARFGDAIRTPLDRTSGTLTATPRAYDAELAREAGEEKLAVYNRQYWFRLFDVMQSAFPLTTRLLGAWTFNALAEKFLLEHPPTGWDVDHAPDAFEYFVIAEEQPAEIAEAAWIDAAYREVFRAPKTTPFRPTAEDAAKLLDSRLEPSPAFAVIVEHFALIDLRKKILAERAESRVDTPQRLASPRGWALVRTDEGTLQVPLATREADLFTLLRTMTVRDALARLERSCDDEERKTLPEKTRAWLARSVELGCWVSRR